MADRWIVSEDRRTVVNATSGIAVEAVKDRTSSLRWTLRLQTSGYLVDLAVREGDGAEGQIVEAFDKLLAWINEGAEILSIVDVIGAEAVPDLAIVEEPEP